MIMEERKHALLDIIKKKEYASVKYLSEHLFASESTIRRDLNELEVSGFIKRTHGGAVIVKTDSIERSLVVRYNTNYKRKKIIADLAIQFINNNQSLFIDSSSTCLMLAQKLSPFKNLKILTNGVLVSDILCKMTSAEIYCACGRVYPKRSGTNGPETCEYISKHAAQVAFVSCRGIDDKLGLTDSTEAEALVKSYFQQYAQKTIVLVDSSKFNTSFFHQSLPFNRIDVIISDKEFPDNLKIPLTKNNIKIITP